MLVCVERANEFGRWRVPLWLTEGLGKGTGDSSCWGCCVISTTDPFCFWLFHTLWASSVRGKRGLSACVQRERFCEEELVQLSSFKLFADCLRRSRLLWMCLFKLAQLIVFYLIWCINCLQSSSVHVALIIWYSVFIIRFKFLVLYTRCKII